MREREIEMLEYQRKYENLPTNVQNAIMVAYQKKKHSDFYYKLLDVYQKATIFTELFYAQEQAHKRIWKERKMKEFEGQ
jgi:hypothetical protein